MENEGTRTRCKWSTRQLEDAIRAVRRGNTIKSASKQYGIPRRTLGDYIKRGATSKIRRGGKSTLMSREEKALCQRIIRLSQVACPLTPKTLRSLVYEYCEENQIKHKFNTDKKKAGRKWLRLFVARHPDIRKRKAQHLNEARAQKLNRAVVSDYFSKLKEIMIQNDLMVNPELIFNMDEKGCQLSIHSQPMVLAEKCSRRNHYRGKEHGENVIVACGSAAGMMIPPMILFKGVRRKEEWLDDMPPGSAFQMTPKGSMTIDVFLLWLEHFAKFKPAGKCLLILDGAKCHISLQIADKAAELDIILFFLPSNTTHELQPLDKSCFKPFETYWDDEVLRLWQNKQDSILNKHRFGAVLTPCLDKAMTPKNIKAGFAATGIYPFRPDIIPDDAFAPSAVTTVQTGEDMQPAIISGEEKQSGEGNQPAAQPGPSKMSCATLHRPSRKANSRPTKVTVDFSDSSSSLDSSPARPGPSKMSCATLPRPTRKTNSRPTKMIDFFDSSSSIDSSDSEEFLPPKEREELINMKFSTPRRSVSQRGGKKSFNCKAMVLNKSLFTPIPPQEVDSMEKLGEPQKENPTQSKICGKGQKSSKKDWYCFVCGTCEIRDMRPCIVCSKYVHDECVGFTKADKDLFTCPDCCH